MVLPIAQIHQGEGLFRQHWIGRNVGDQCDVFAGGQARDQVIKLENKSSPGNPQRKPE
jgi:hypothetical protein